MKAKKRGFLSTGTKRRHGMNSSLRKRSGAKGRYRNRQGSRRKQSVPQQRSQIAEHGHKQTYNDDFKAGFAQGFEDGQSEAVSTFFE